MRRGAPLIRKELKGCLYILYIAQIITLPIYVINFGGEVFPLRRQLSTYLVKTFLCVKAEGGHVTAINEKKRTQKTGEEMADKCKNVIIKKRGEKLLGKNQIYFFCRNQFTK